MNKYTKYFVAVLSICTILCVPVSAAAQAYQSKKYVSLGDSVAAGAGLPLADGSPQSMACGRSKDAYPYGIAASLGAQHLQVACGGATLKEGILGPQTVGNLTLPAQVEAAFANGRPDILTLTVGTNDVRWSDFIRKCYADTCGTWQDSMTVNGYLAAVYSNLNETFKLIKEKSAGKLPKVVVTGYFQPLSTENPACFDTQGITNDEISWVRWQDSKLNAVITATAWQYDFVKYAPVSFDGHELCSSDPWIQGLRDKASYHPTAAGQAAIGQAILRKL